jgi:hypothetical protein
MSPIEQDLVPCDACIVHSESIHSDSIAFKLGCSYSYHGSVEADCHLIRKVIGYAIIGYDGDIWSVRPGFYGNPVEFAQIVTVFKPISDRTYKGLTFQNELYVNTTITDDTSVAQRSHHNIVVA